MGKGQEAPLEDIGSNTRPSDQDKGKGPFPPADIEVIDQTLEDQVLGQDGQDRHGDKHQGQKPAQTP